MPGTLGEKMSRVQLRLVGTGILALILVVGFQNCGKPFSTQNQSSEIPHDLTATPATLNVYSSSIQVTDGSPLVKSTSYELRLDGDVTAPTSVTWSANTGVAGFANCSVVGAELLKRSFTCSSTGLAHVAVQVTFAEAPSVSVVFERQIADIVVPPPPSNTILFTIAPGTANAPWNTVATAALVFKGQVLRIVNGDTIAHRMHTPGTPCPHQPTNSAPGQHYDCLISTKHAATATNMYDHGAGNSAVFYVEAIDGVEQYNRLFTVTGTQKACMTCHGAVATSAKKGATLAQIKAAIAANRGGMGSIVLTDNEIKAIVFELGK